ncbi:hypothetical protein B0H14DRAFT_3456015 [Mycena olivaceomarginata]|nr:hypothetical protein B0H14DRAFT_3456015 [Mycena olivaceomarginata]
MNTKNIFEKTDWIGQGKLWASALPLVRKAATKAFSIPQHMEDLLPSPYLPIAQMLDFGLPLQNTSPSAQLPAQYFSTTPPDITGEALRLRIRHLPIPDTKTVRKLLVTSRQCWSDGTQSIVYSHIGGDVNHFPLWVLTYWSAVVDIKRDPWGPWHNCQQWINKYRKPTQKNPHHAALAEEASLMLSMAPWGHPKPPGFSNSEPFHTLWPDTIAYGTAPDLRWLRDLGDDIVENR